MDSENTKLEAENSLIEIADWAILSMKIPGYLFFTTNNPRSSEVFQTPSFMTKPDPRMNSAIAENPKLLHFFSVSKDVYQSQPTSSQKLKTFSTLDFKSLFHLNLYSIYICLWFLSSLFLTLFTFYKGYEILVKFGDAARRDNIQVFSEVSEQLMATYNVIAAAAFLLIFRVIFCLKNSRTLEFWTSSVNLYHEFRTTLQPNPDSQQLFQNIRTDLAKDSIWQWSIVLIQSGCVGLTTLYMNHFLSKRFMDVGIVSLILGVFCLTIINCHVGLTIWLGFFIRFYTTCFKSVKCSISALSEVKESSCSHNFDVGVTLQNGQFELDPPIPKIDTLLERQLDLFELVHESVEKFNKFYVLALIVDMFIGLSNALATVYHISRVTYESGSVSWEVTAHIMMKIPQHFLYVLRLFYLINLSDDMTQEALGVLRSLQKVKTVLLVGRGGGVGSGAALLAKMQILVTRVSLNPPSISPGNYFRMSRRLLASVVSILATYFIILTELREEDVGRSLIRSLLNNSCTAAPSLRNS